MPAAKPIPPKRKRAAAPKRAARADALNAALGEAAWSEADRALAQALADSDALAASLGAAEASVVEAMQMLAQSLGQAARRRGLARFGDVGARVAYDSARHELTRSVRAAPDHVRVTAPGVARADQVLVKARVTPVRPRRKP